MHNESGANLDSMRVRVDHEIIEPLQNGIIVARLVTIANLGRLKVRK